MSHLKEVLDEAENKIQRLNSLVEASKIINSTLNLDEVLRLILSTATKNTQADRGTIYLLDKDKNEIWSKSTQGGAVVEIRLPLGVGIAGHVAKTGEIVSIEDAYKDSRFNHKIDETTGYTTKSILCMPMRNKDGEIIGVFQILNKKNGRFSGEDVQFLDALSTHASLAIENARLYQEALEKKRLEGEMELAREIQERLLPEKLPNIKGYEFAAINRPAEQVGGDYYDFAQRKDRRLAFSIGDVSGKGVPAALLMASLRASFQTQAHEALPVSLIAKRLNHLIFHCTSPTAYITFFSGVLNPVTGLLRYTNCGHNPPILVRSSGVMELLEKGGLVLGLMDAVAYEKGSVQMKSGDSLVLYTDGVSEAINSKDEEYGEPRLYELLINERFQSAQELLQTILDDVSLHQNGMPQNDDVTLVIIKRI